MAVFLDRDGTIGGHGGGEHPLEFCMYEFTPAAIRLLNDLGIKVFIFTNQSRIARGYFTEEELMERYNNLQIELKEHAAKFDGIYYCPHKIEDFCECQKPNIGMLLKAQQDHHLDLAKCYIVGDNGSADMVAAHKVGAKKILVRTGWEVSSLTTYRDSWREVEADFVATNLLHAVHWIIEDMRQTTE
ncbi:HAD-IIIA family hydrolase [Solibacillus sp. CAU 1738]|uniref:HAD-IIIA family hydrolase n=1 Tax=Solibacillus sp. CAU 1738 TaxID=3140363 RepID=UPI00325FF8C2